MEKDMNVKVNAVPCTNRAYINIQLDPDDVTKILRVWEWYKAKKIDPKAPIWEVEALYEQWLDSPFDWNAWRMASTPYAKGTIPKDFARSIKWAYRMSNRETKPKDKSGATVRGIELTREELEAIHPIDKKTEREIPVCKYEMDKWINDVQFVARKVW